MGKWGLARVLDSGQPILGSWKVSEVLERYPELLDVMVAQSPAFSRLRNPVLRRVQSRLVTVAQAARIAGVDGDQLVRKLNAAIGLAPPESAPCESQAGSAGQLEPTPHQAPAPTARPEWVTSAPVAVEIDVRTYLERGEEPLSAILRAASQVLPGQVLRLRSNFEPVPLYDVLGRRGFTPWADRIGADEWEIRFHQGAQLLAADAASSAPSPDPDAPVTPRDAADVAAGREEPTATIKIDVSELVPPEPMIRILEALEQLAPGETLLVYHVRRPIYLYPRLEELGCTHETWEIGPNRVELLIRKASG